MFPYNWTIVVLRVQSVEEFAEVPNPAGYLFSFNIREGVGSSGDVGLVDGDCPIQAKV